LVHQVRYPDLKQCTLQSAALGVSVENVPFQLLETYNVIFVLKLSALLLHGTQDDLKGIDQVVEYDCAPLLPLRLVEAASMNDAHLLEHRRLPTLSSSCEQTMLVAILTCHFSTPLTVCHRT
jgi:hypothetical protein